MINIEQAKQSFLKYTDKFDSENKNISRKIYHTFRVMELSKNIAKSINLEEEQVKLAIIIALLHDIGRFEQMKKYGTFVDLKSIDHGELGAQILMENNFIREFIEKDDYDQVIIKAIRNHNKFEIEEGLNENEILQAKIIRDADKLDILFEGIEIFWDSEEEKSKIENEVPVETEYFDNIKKHSLIKRTKESKNKLDSIFVKLAFVFDFNFKYSFEHLYKENYVNKIIDRFDFKNKATKEQIEEVRDIVNKYVLEKKGKNYV